MEISKLYVTEWKMSKNIKTMKISVWLMNLSKTARIPQYLFSKNVLNFKTSSMISKNDMVLKVSDV